MTPSINLATCGWPSGRALRPRLLRRQREREDSKPVPSQEDRLLELLRKAEGYAYALAHSYDIGGHPDQVYRLVALGEQIRVAASDVSDLARPIEPHSAAPLHGLRSRAFSLRRLLRGTACAETDRRRTGCQESAFGRPIAEQIASLVLGATQSDGCAYHSHRFLLSLPSLSHCRSELCQNARNQAVSPTRRRRATAPSPPTAQDLISSRSPALTQPWLR